MSEENKRKTANTSIIKSFDYAINGLVYAIRTQRNMKIHMLMAVLVIIASLFLNLTRIEIIVLIFAIGLVLITEIINTSNEHMVNLITEKHHPLAMRIKDMSAGAVLFASICAAVVGILIFIRKETLSIFENSIVLNKISEFPPYFTAVIIFLVIVMSLLMKGLNQKALSIEGGMPSIHTAVATSLAVISYFLSSNIYVFIISMILALMIAQTRVSSNIHNLWEVFIGALLGSTVTIIVFQLIIM